MSIQSKPVIAWHCGCPKCGLNLARVWHVEAKDSVVTEYDIQRQETVSRTVMSKEHLRLQCAACDHVWTEKTKDANKRGPSTTLSLVKH